MQTAKEKAKELFNSMKWDGEMSDEKCFTDFAKQCALIAVDELISQQEEYNNGSFYPSNYYQEVKKELEFL